MRVEIRDPQDLVGIVELRGGVAVPDEGAAKILVYMTVVGPGNPGRQLHPTDGEEYRRALPRNLRGTYLRATLPIGSG